MCRRPESISVILGLVEKELRQHKAMLFLIVAVLATEFVILQGVDVLVEIGGSVFSQLSLILFWQFPLTCLVLGNVLIASEFRQKTQVFLDGLPMPRWVMLAVKYVFGLVVILVTASSLLIIAFCTASVSDVMTGRFALLLWMKTLGWSWCCWAVLFSHAFLGKYRLPFGIAVVCLLVWAEQGAGLLISRLGPFELISERYSFERNEIPTQAVLVTSVMIIAFTGCGFALGLVRDATLATMLSERMSAREKMASIGLSIVAILFVSTAASRAEKTEPLQLPGSTDVVLRSARISVAAAVKDPTLEERSLMQRHADQAAEFLATVADYLNCKRLPQVFIVHRRDFEELEFENGVLDSRQGVLLRLNLSKTPPESTELQSRLLKQVLGAHQHYRLGSDTRGWVLEGFATWWPLRERAATTSELIRLWSHADEVQEVTITDTDLRSWLKFSAELDNETLVSTLAAAGVLEIGKVNSDGQRRFLSAVLGYEAPHDFRATLHDSWYNVSYLLRSNTGMTIDALAQRWTKSLHETTAAAEENKGPNP